MEDLEIRKKINNNLKKASDDSKLTYCLCCHKEVTSFKNSHSLPKFILNNISNDGYVLTSNKYFKFPYVDDFKGIKRSGTFKRICEECENKLFREYESIDNLLVPPRKKIMTEIDLKNCLKMYDKRLTEIALYDNLLNMTSDEFYFNSIIQKQYINNLDLKEIKFELDRDLKILTKKSTSSFDLIYWDKLDYITPIAFQGYIALYCDLNGDVINNLYNMDENYFVEYINICIFPLLNETIVMMFINKEYKKYKRFINQFKKLTKERKLQLISFIIINYCEDYFISKDSQKKLLENKKIEKISHNMIDFISLDEKMSYEIIKEKRNELFKYKDFPNLLGMDYSININK